MGDMGWECLVLVRGDNLVRFRDLRAVGWIHLPNVGSIHQRACVRASQADPYKLDGYCIQKC